MTYNEFTKIFGECPFRMISMGHKFTDPEVLKIVNGDRVTIAHIMALQGHKFTDPEILKLTTNNGTTVKDIMNRIND